MCQKTKTVLFTVLGLLISLPAFAAYPGVCTLVLYQKIPGLTVNYSTVPSVTFNAADGTFTWGTPTTIMWGANVNRIDFYVFWKETSSGTWNYKSGSNYNFFPNTYTPNGSNFRETTAANPADVTLVNAAYPQCVGQCASKQGQASDPVLIGLPYNADYYSTVGVCDGNCQIKPNGGIILNQYASDGSGWTVGPWAYTGQDCVPGVTPAKPAQPSPEEQCENQRDACQAQCDGRAFEHNCTTGACECFGSPGYNTDPPKDPTTPTTDPGSPSVPSPQTPATDPGVGGNQLGAQISNQAKQIAQGDAQLGQLGAINNKLGAVISNQGKQLAQGDTMIDYQRRQLGVQEDIRDKLDELTSDTDTPSLPEQPEYDGTIPDLRNWTEYDDASQVGIAKANREIQIIEDQITEDPFGLTIDTSGAVPYLHGPMFGKEIYIRFDRPWMLTGYQIMNATLIGIGYLQAAMMVHRVVTGA